MVFTQQHVCSEVIAQYLPKDGPAAREAMKLVTGQRMWMFDVGCAVGQVVGTCYQLESNTLKELQKLWNSGQTGGTIKFQKKNFKVTMLNLQRLEQSRNDAQKKIAECRALADQMVDWQGKEQKMQHAVMQVIAQFGGSAQCEAFLKDLEASQKALNNAREQEKAAAQKLAKLSGQREELQCKSLVFESIAANEKGSLAELTRRADDLDREAAEKAKEAAETLNIAYKMRSGWLGGWYTDWVDNRGDCAKWRAERFKQISKEAKESESDQQRRAAKAAGDAAAIKGQLTTVGKDLEERPGGWNCKGRTLVLFCHRLLWLEKARDAYGYPYHTDVEH